MNDTRKYLPFCGAVASEFIRHDNPGLASCSPQKLPKETLRRDSITFRLHEDVAYRSILIDSSPQVMAHTLDLQEDFVEMPLRSQLSFVSSSKFLRKVRTEFVTPLPHRFVAELNATPSFLPLPDS
jgi:hypothetical protein